MAGRVRPPEAEVTVSSLRLMEGQRVWIASSLVHQFKAAWNGSQSARWKRGRSPSSPGPAVVRGCKSHESF
jgi:hypothetical protein